MWQNKFIEILIRWKCYYIINSRFYLQTKKKMTNMLMRYPQQFLYKQTSYTLDFTSREESQSLLFLWYFMIHLHTYARLAASVWPLCMTNWRARAREHENMCTIMEIIKYHFIKKKLSWKWTKYVELFKDHCNLFLGICNYTCCSLKGRWFFCFF